MSHHKSVLLKECIEGLKINSDGIYVDVTYGGGGHSNEILKVLIMESYLHLIEILMYYNIYQTTKISS